MFSGEYSEICMFAQNTFRLIVSLLTSLIGLEGSKVKDTNVATKTSNIIRIPEEKERTSLNRG